MDRYHVLVSCVLMLVLPVPVPAAAQTATPASAPYLDTAARRQIVEEFARAMREHYVFPDRGETVAARTTAALASGKYDDARTTGELARRLTADASAVVHDKHLSVFSMHEPHGDGAPRQMPAAEAGLTRADKLVGGAGYIELISFPPLSFSKSVIDTVMTSLSGSRALIIDIRRNGGGDPESVDYLVSFLVPPDQAINDIVSRVAKTPDRKRQSFRSVQTPVSFLKVPVYVLTSKATFSGGEEFAYDVQALKRGTLIGETTGGGANPVGPVDIGHGLIAMIPFGRAENPITKSNWEGVGVRPDVSVAADTALGEALRRAGLKPSADIAAASTKRLFSPRTTQLPGSEAALRRFLGAVAKGVTLQDIVAPQAASIIQQQLPHDRAELARLGELRSVEFRQLNPFGADEYKLTFANERRKTALALDHDGRIVMIFPLAPLSPGE